jgi:molecular chaperone DnaK
MSRIVGIDLGTTNSLVAVVESGIPMVLADAEGHRLTPSVVHYPEGDAAPTVGHAAQRVRALHPQHTVSSIKRFMGRRASEVADEEQVLPYPLRGTGNGPVSVEMHGRTVTPEEVSAQVLRQLKAVAERALEMEVARAVITVPAYFNDAQRSATKRAGELAGLTVERIINEPTAAALAYGLNRLKEKSKVAVYDLGGGTFDLSILELHEGVFQVLSTHGNTQLGGDDLDRCLTEFLLEQLKRVRGDIPQSAIRNPQLAARLREAAEAAKIRLSSETEAEISLPFLTPELSFEYRLTRAELETLTRDLIERTRSHCIRALSDAKLEAKDLDQVILVGGQTRMPLVRQLVAEWFGCAEFEETRGNLRLGNEYHQPSGPLLNTSVNPDEAVALGAAIQAAILSGDFQNMLLLDVTPLSLGLETFGGLMNVIIPRNSTIPVKAGEMFTTAVDNQRKMLIHVLQGERERARDNWTLGRFTLEFEPAPRGVPRVGVQFEIDANGILNVLARDTKTGRQTVVEMKSAVDVEDAAVQQMVEESVEHAFDDLAARRWVEGKLKAQELLRATRKGLAECEGGLSGEQSTKLREAMAAIESCLAGERAETATGDVTALKAACDALDQASHPLAELLMDRAMEALLRQRGMLI